MINRMHTRSKIFFPEPYVVRVEYPADFDSAVKYNKTIRNTYKLIKGTWGYSQLQLEESYVNNPWEPNRYVKQVYVNMMRGYVCFKDDLDALQFRLSIDNGAIKVLMWPKSLYFTIHEVTYE